MKTFEPSFFDTQNFISEKKNLTICLLNRIIHAMWLLM